MYHELFVLLMHADESNGQLNLDSIPIFIEELLDSTGQSNALKKALKKLTHHRLLEKIDHQTYQITQSGRTELKGYKLYMEQQHQKCPNYYIDPALQSHPPNGNTSIQALCISLGAALGLFRNAS